MQTKNLLTILIFDQFEEFFFNCPQPADRRKFWEFLHQCLDDINIPYVKVILSLREDYLHYLLECDRLTNLQATNNDIINKDIRYYFGNFSPEEAKTVIYSLTEKSAALEPALVDELVRDLAGDMGEVRPIELQVVGTQLETEKITTLVGYQEFGTKEKLVDRFLATVVEDCGAENERVAQLVLYLLTDENNTRPLKTRAELADALEGEVDKLDLVLEILVTSGIVFLIPQSPADCYQLVHDYLVALIRQQRGAELLAELARERQQRQEAEAKLNRFLKRRLLQAYIAGAGLLAVTAVAVVFGVESYKNGINAEINSLRNSSEALSRSDADTESLIEGLKAGQKLKYTSTFWIKPYTRNKTVATLHQAIYGIKVIEQNTDECPRNRTLKMPRYSTSNTTELWKGNKQIKTFKSSQNIDDVDFSPDKKIIAYLGKGNIITLRSFDNNKIIKTFTSPGAGVQYIYFSSDSKSIYSCSLDRTKKQWSIYGKQIETFKGSSSWINSVSFSPDGKIIASTSDDTIKLWTVNGKLIKTFKVNTRWVNSVSFSPDGKIIASTSDDTIKLWTVDGKLTKTFPSERYANKGHSSWINSISFSPDGKIIASADNTTIKLWTVDGKLIKTLIEPGVKNISVSPNGKIIASTSDNKTISDKTTITLRSVDDSKTIKTLTEPSVNINISFSPDGKIIAFGSEDKTIKLRSVDDGKLITTFKGHNSPVIGINFSSDGKTITSLSEDSTIKRWNLDLEKLLVEGCDLLHDYLINNPQIAEELQVCKSSLLVARGKLFVQKGYYNLALNMFTRAKALDKKLNFNPEVKAAPALIKHGEKLVKQRKFKEAVAAYNKARKIDPNLEIPDNDWKTLSDSVYKTTLNPPCP